jgi:integrase/recombinase XerD
LRTSIILGGSCSTGISAAIRRKELVGLVLVDLDAKRGVLLVREGKGGKDRLVSIGERAIAWLEKDRMEALPRLTRQRDVGVLFVTARGGRIRANRLTERCTAISPLPV